MSVAVKESAFFVSGLIMSWAVQGYGRSFLLEDCPTEDVAEGMMLLTVAIALVANEHLVTVGYRNSPMIRCAINEHTIFEVAKLLFDNSGLTRETVNPYIEKSRKARVLSIGARVMLTIFFANLSLCHSSVIKILLQKSVLLITQKSHTNYSVICFGPLTALLR